MSNKRNWSEQQYWISSVTIIHYYRNLTKTPYSWAFSSNRNCCLAIWTVVDLLLSRCCSTLESATFEPLLALEVPWLRSTLPTPKSSLRL